MKAQEYIDKIKAGAAVPEVLEELKQEMFKIINDRRAQTSSSKFSVYKECQSKWHTIAGSIEAPLVAFDIHLKATDADFFQLIETAREARAEQMKNMAQRRAR